MEEMKMQYTQIPKENIKQVVHFYKSIFENGFNTVSMIQDQSEKIMKTMVDQSPWINVDSKKTITQWTSTYKKGLEDFKKIVDDGYLKVDEFIDKIG
jgi:hypothetical protein